MSTTSVDASEQAAPGPDGAAGAEAGSTVTVGPVRPNASARARALGMLDRTAAIPFLWIVPVVVSVAMLLLSIASVLAVRSVSAADEQRSRQSVTLASEAREAAARVSREIDAVRLSGLLASRDPVLAQVASSGSATPAQVAAARRPLQTLAELRSGLVAIARLRAADGREVLRVADGTTTTTGLSSGARGATWVLDALAAGSGVPVTSAEHPSVLVGGDSVSTAVAVGPEDAPVGVLEIETPVSWLHGVAVAASASGAVVDFVTPADAEMSMGLASAQGSGVVDGADEATAWARTSYDPSFGDTVALDWVVTASQAAVPTGVEALSPLSVTLGAVGLLLLLAGVALALLWWLVVRRRRLLAEHSARRLQARLAEMSDALARVAAGNLATDLPDFEQDDLRVMATSFVSTIGTLRSLVGQAQEYGAALAQASVELTAGAAQQASAAAEQSTVVAETTATIEELAATAAQIAVTAEGVARAASTTLTLTEEGRSAVMTSVEVMDGVAGRVDVIEQRALALGDTGREIGRILEVIDDLSERTNMLALNAAIEAARAGEHGAGFAVVAAEVRRLAERARASTTQIQGLVTRIAADASATVVAAGEGQREVAHARGVAHDAAAALDRIASMVDETTTASREISFATQQQRSASDQVVLAMGQVADASRQYAVGSRQSAESAEELAVLAESLSGTIGAFDTAERSRSPRAHQVDDVPALV
jgi:methyl-accepting chemotaxis protein